MSPALWVPLCVAALLVALVLGLIAHTHPVLPVDIGFTSAVQRIHSAAFQRVMIFISALGYPPWAEIIETTALVTLALLRRPLEALFLALTLLADGGAALIKVLVARPRPSPKEVEVLLRLGSFSFPSGHVVHFTVFYGFLAVVLATCWRSTWWRNSLMACCIALIALVGLSRIYLGEHWLTDVIAGYLFGGVFLVVLVAI
jgi:undecaprenyl-diphosphatase